MSPEHHGAPRLWRAPDARQRINLAWLIKLRWGAVMGQTVAVVAAYALLHITLPLSPLLCVLGITLGSNAGLERWAPAASRVPEWVLGAILTLDILLLTALLYFTGGSTNPFNFLYLVHIALAAVVLRGRAWLGTVVTLSVICFAGLFWLHVPLPGAGREASLGLSPRLHQQGLATAFALAAGFIVHFLHRLTGALGAMETALAAARELSARNERLTSLATLAAGAAHELATPLATIAVVAKELEHQLAGDGGRGEGAAQDARLIREQVERCRTVLTHMASDAGASTGEPFVRADVARLLNEAVRELPTPQRVRVHIRAAGPALLYIPWRTGSQAVRAVIKNAVEASGPAQDVDVTAHVDAHMCVIEVRDRGHGMMPQVLSRVSEPFFTTKGPGAGMGLGLFLTRTFLERLGGGLDLHSAPNRGTTARLRFPLDQRFIAHVAT